ncbi:hypothetical protein [Williamsia sterculiae]|uniref:Uncharacterized protein n=1 Tax=Williamsia sterculiae TaxID=1344003 RepID=A0A1N7HEE8_9NOCA|nr:hypothetical protein [Williamsia sterculiae]SIS23078.1 hypothetical protein SAMN05445060_4047 [Williamsia sterculiae]
MTTTEARHTRRPQAAGRRSLDSLHTAARVAAEASKKTGRPVSARVSELLKDQQR